MKQVITLTPKFKLMIKKKKKEKRTCNKSTFSVDAYETRCK